MTIYFITIGVSPPGILPYKSHFWPGKHPEPEVSLCHSHPVWLQPHSQATPTLCGCSLIPRPLPPCVTAGSFPGLHLLQCLIVQVWMPGNEAGVGTCLMFSFLVFTVYRCSRCCGASPSSWSRSDRYSFWSKEWRSMSRPEARSQYETTSSIYTLTKSWWYMCMFVLLFFLCSKYESVAVNTCLVLMVGGALVAALWVRVCSNLVPRLLYMGTLAWEQGYVCLWACALNLLGMVVMSSWSSCRHGRAWGEGDHKWIL